MLKFYILLGVIGVAIIIFKSLTSGEAKEPEEGSYEKRKILTEAEQRFYNELRDLVPDKYYIFPQIHLASLLTVRAQGKSWRRLFNKVIQKSVDFILVDKVSFETKLVIELDDRTHFRKKRVSRDDFVNASLKAAGINIIHIKEHNLDELKTFLAIEQTSLNND